jgi:hypothetical protein
MLIGVPGEILAGEKRVAVTPETAKKLKAQGHTVKVQSGAGDGRQRASTPPTRPPALRSPTAPAPSAPSWCSRCAAPSPTS